MRSKLAITAILVFATSARADRIGSDEPAIAIFQTRSAIAPSPPASPLGGDELGLDLQVRTFGFGWGRTWRHHVQVSELESPDFGDPEQMFLHFGRYDLAWRGDALELRAGVRAVTLWSGAVRFATPIAGVRTMPLPRLVIEGAIELPGLFAASLRATRRSVRRDVAVELRAAWPADAATRAELRVRARDYAIAPDPGDMEVARALRDVTVTAGLGLAVVARDRMRGLPGLVGLAMRADDRGPAVLAVVELGFAVE